MADLPNIPLPRVAHLEQVDSYFGDIGKKLEKAVSLGDEFQKTMASSTKRTKDLAEGLQDIAKKNKKLMDDFAKQQSKYRSLLSTLEEGSAQYREMMQKVNKTQKDFNEAQEKIVEQFAEQEEALDSARYKFKDFAQNGLQITLNLLDKIGKALIMKGLKGMELGIEGIWTVMKRAYELQERWTRVMGAFNMRLGSFSPNMKAARGEAMHWEGTIRGLTDNFGEGLEMFQEYTEGFKRTLPKDEEQKWGNLGLGIARGLGLGGRAAGEWLHSAYQMGQTSDETAESFKEIALSAIEANVPVNMLTKEFSEAREMLVSFGKDGQKAFIQNFTAMKKLGVSLKSLEQFMKSTDNFDDAVKSMAKVNTLFGTTVNALEMVMEQDPSKRMEMVRKQMLAQGKTFDSLSRQEREVLAETMKVSQDELAGVLRDNKTLEDVQKKQEKERLKEMNAQKFIQKQTLKTAQTQFAMSAAYDKITVALIKMLRPFTDALNLTKVGGAGFINFGDALQKGLEFLVGNPKKGIKGLFEKIGDNKEFKDTLTFIAIKVKEFVSWITKLNGQKEGIDGFVSSLSIGFRKAWNAVEPIIIGIKDFFANEKVQNGIKWMIENIDRLALAWVGVKAVMLGLKLSSFISQLRNLVNPLRQVTQTLQSSSALPSGIMSAADEVMSGGGGAYGRGAAGGGVRSAINAAGKGILNMGPKGIGGAVMGAGIGSMTNLGVGGIQGALGVDSTGAGDIAGIVGGIIGGAIGGPVGAAVFGATAKALTDGLPDLWKALAKKGSSYADEDPYAAEKELAKKRDPLQTQKNTLWLQREKEKQKVEETIEQQITDKKLTNEKDINKLRKQKLNDLEKWEKDNINSRMIAQMEAVAMEKGVTADEYYKLVEGVMAGQTKSSGNTFGASEGIGYKLLEAINGRGPLFTRDEKKRPVWGRHGFEEGFASGGIVTSPTRALVGENGPEAIIPLRAIARPEGRTPMKFGGSTAKDIVNLAANSGRSASGQTRVEVVSSPVYLDGKEVGRNLTRLVIGA
jgi:hypothetical protein